MAGSFGVGALLQGMVDLNKGVADHERDVAKTYVTVGLGLLGLAVTLLVKGG